MRTFLVVPWVVGTLALVACRKEAPPAVAPPPQAVIAAEVIVRNQRVENEAIGQTRGSQEVEVRARVEGVLEKIHFDEGRSVKQGDLLYTIDPKPYETMLLQASGNLARAEATWTKSRQDLARFEPLMKRNAISRQQYDEAVAGERANAAAVETSKAQVQSAQYQLDYTSILAPTDGLVGKSEVQIGNLVGRGQSTLLTSISKVDPIHVRFSVSEREYLDWVRANPGAQHATTAPKDIFALLLADGSKHPHPGSPVFLDRLVDPTTGTLLIEAAFPNPEKAIRPGQFARVRYATSIQTNAILVPQRAVQEMQAVYSVVVVGEGNKAEFRPVTPGARIGSFWMISSGLRPGEKVVVEGAQKLRPGALLAPVYTNLTATAAPAAP
jgi:membrane fusion protein (multidrug efflux system)